MISDFGLMICDVQVRAEGRYMATVLDVSLAIINQKSEIRNPEPLP